jgi:histidine ammonia-lyase
LSSSCACQGIDFLAPLKTGTLATQAYAAVRAKSPKVTKTAPWLTTSTAVSTLIASALFARLVH